MSRPAGIPLLSGPPPAHPGPDQRACRKCGREFNILFHRQRKCMHCGFGYCTSCTDYQALMPRSGSSRGYDLAHVCAFCSEFLNVTALGRVQLRSLPLTKLRRYIAAYNIPAKNAIDKNDLVDAVMTARTPQGCLSRTHEEYYRKHSVPTFSSSGSSSTSGTGSRSNRSFPRPDLDPNRRQPPRDDTAHSTRPRTTSAPTAPRTTHPTSTAPNISRPTSSNGRPTTPTAASAAHPPLPPPPMSTLVTLPRSALTALHVGTLKQILFEARVRIPPGVVEKEELVERVWAIVEEEKRKDNEGIDDLDSEHRTDTFEEPYREEESVTEMMDPESDVHMDGVHEHGQENDCHSNPDATDGHSEASPSAKTKPRPRSKQASMERSGLCIICQDEEANIAIVDCGHLCMCRECSDLVLNSSKECPLCRTRIVTESRLLRIFKT